MIPNAHLQAWVGRAPWPDSRQIEQDLIISRALCDLFSAPDLKGKIAFRGGTAINKLLFERPLRYSEDIDLVQITAEPIGPTIDAIRDALSWLGKFKREQAGHSTHLVFRFAPEAEPDSVLKLKVEINTREHEAFYGTRAYPFKVENGWFSGAADIISYDKEELFGTKLRALLQRRKNRDLFDLREGFRELSLDPARLVAAFEHYLSLEDNVITRANAEQRMLEKLTKSLTEDIVPLLPPGVEFSEEDAIQAFGLIWNDVLPLLKGGPWKTSQKAIEQLREKRFPDLLR